MLSWFIYKQNFTAEIKNMLQLASMFVYQSLPVSLCYKTFLTVIYEFLQKGGVFVPGRPFQPILMFAGKARSLP